jgi:3-hexulose-6-phosphate synthase
MKLQLALDNITTEMAVNLVKATSEHIDVIKIGSSLIKGNGLQVLKNMRSIFPEKKILVDLRTINVSEYEADFCFKLGADIITVSANADIQRLKGSVKAANKQGKKVMVDIVHYPNKLSYIEKLKLLNVHLIGVHSGINQQYIGLQPLEELNDIKARTKIPLCVAGDINLSNIEMMIKAKPHTIIISKAITTSYNPTATAKALKTMMLNVNGKQPPKEYAIL